MEPLQRAEGYPLSRSLWGRRPRPFTSANRRTSSTILPNAPMRVPESNRRTPWPDPAPRAPVCAFRHQHGLCLGCLRAAALSPPFGGFPPALGLLWQYLVGSLGRPNHGALRVGDLRIFLGPLPRPASHKGAAFARRISATANESAAELTAAKGHLSCLPVRGVTSRYQRVLRSLA